MVWVWGGATVPDYVPTIKDREVCGFSCKEHFILEKTISAIIKSNHIVPNLYAVMFLFFSMEHK